MGVTFHGGHTQPPKQQERSETKDGESWLWEHTYVKVEWFQRTIVQEFVSVRNRNPFKTMIYRTRIRKPPQLLLSEVLSLGPVLSRNGFSIIRSLYGYILQSLSAGVPNSTSTLIQAKCSFSTFSDYRVKYCFNRGPLAPEFNQSGTSHLGKLAIQFSVEHHIWDRSNIWDSLSDFTSGTDSFGTTHLGQFMRLYIWDGSGKEQHIWDKFYPLQSGTGSGKGTTHLGEILSVTVGIDIWEKIEKGTTHLGFSLNKKYRKK